MATKVLLVEDSLSIQTMVETTFTHEGFEVMVVGDALEGLQLVQTAPPDIILADASMPGLDGFQLCQRIRQSTGGRQVPVVLLTSGFAAYDKTRGDRAGVTTHLAKPFEPRALLDLVKQLVPMAPYPTPRTATVATLLPRPEEPFLETNGMEGLEDTWGEFSHRSTADGLPQITITQPLADAAPARGQTPRPVQPRESPANLIPGMLPQMLGEHVVQLLRETLDAHIATALAQLMPPLLDTVRDVVQAQMPALLEALLQQEIAKLKHAAEQDAHHG